MPAEGSPTPASRPARLDVGVVGAGRVGSVLGAALLRAGHRVVAASAVSAASRRRAKRWLPGARLVAPDELLSAAGGLVLLTVPDDALPGLVGGLAGSGRLQRGTMVAHVSGRYGVSVLEPLTAAGALPLALHPMMAFTSPRTDLARLSGATFGVTAPSVLRPAAEALVIEMGGEPVFVREEDRALYHAALAWGSNYLVTVVDGCLQLLRQVGVDAPARAVAPLLGAALDNALRSGAEALTGPVARGDAGTVAAQLAALRAAAPELVDAYLALARLTADRALAAHRLDASAAVPLLDVLAAGGEVHR